jgi:hypothetical protein
MGHHHRKRNGLKSFGRALQHGSKEVFHEFSHVLNTPGHIAEQAASTLSSNFLPLLIVGGIVAVVVLRK